MASTALFKGYLLFILSQVKHIKVLIAGRTMIFFWLILRGNCMEVKYHHFVIKKYAFKDLTGDMSGSVFDSESYFSCHTRTDEPLLNIDDIYI
jgi:hypothetical protein